MDVEILSLMKQFGPVLALLIFFVVMDWKKRARDEEREKAREARLGDRLDKIQDSHNLTMETTVKDNTRAMTSVADACNGLASKFDRIPCVVDEAERQKRGRL